MTTPTTLSNSPFGIDLNRGRDILNALTRTNTATIMRKSHVSDGFGGQTDTYASVGTFACSLVKYPVRPLEREGSQQIQSYTDWRFNFDRDVEVLQTDRIVCQGRTFEVLGRGVGTFEMSNRVITVEVL